jgi:hypothetical protein
VGATETENGRSVNFQRALVLLSSFRLDVATAGGFFHAVYHFLAGEASDNGTSTESATGARRQILCRDTPDVAQRPYHQDHIHCEVDR